MAAALHLSGSASVMHQAPHNAAVVEQLARISASKKEEFSLATAASAAAAVASAAASLKLANAVISEDNAHTSANNAAAYLMLASDAASIADCAYLGECEIVSNLSQAAITAAHTAAAAAQAFVAAQDVVADHLSSAIQAQENAHTVSTEDNLMFAEATSVSFHETNQALIFLAITLDVAAAAAQSAAIAAHEALSVCLRAEQAAHRAMQAYTVAEVKLYIADAACYTAADVLHKCALAAIAAAEFGISASENAAAAAEAFAACPVHAKDSSTRVVQWLRKAVEQMHEAKQHPRMAELLISCQGLAQTLQKWSWFDDAIRTAAIQLHGAGERNQAIATIRMLGDIRQQVGLSGGMWVYKVNVGVHSIQLRSTHTYIYKTSNLYGYLCML